MSVMVSGSLIVTDLPLIRRVVQKQTGVVEAARKNGGLSNAIEPCAGVVEHVRRSCSHTAAAVSLRAACTHE
jgi:hypothetical protein